MSRTRITLDGTWEFFPDPQGQLGHDALAATPRAIRVPGPWQAQFDDMRDYSGVAWYRHTFPMTKDEGQKTNAGPDQSVVGRPSSFVSILHFGAVDYHTTVWLNGQLLGAHEGGYLPFELDASAALRADGPNELVVKVVDASTDTARFPDYPFSEVPHGKQSWYGPLGGIWQSVYLETRAATHIAAIRVTPDVPGAQARVEVQLSQPAAQDTVVTLALTDPRGSVSTSEHTIPAGAATLAVALPIFDALLWDIGQPNLYTLEATLTDERRTTNDEAAAADANLSSSVIGHSSAAGDSLSATFGMRTIATSPDGNILLNGRIIYLRGALDQDYYPDLIYTPFSDEAIADQFAKAQHMGLNCLRTHIKITDPRYYDAADRAGLLIWTELPNWQNLTAAAKRRARATLEGMVARDWNHPSIIIWTIINENWGTDLGANADHRAWLADTYDFMKQLDPHRLIVGNSACYGNFHVVTDILDFHNYYAMPDHAAQWDEWVATFAARPDWAFAHSYANFDDWRALRGNFWQRGPRTHTAEVRTTGHEPLLVSEFGNWGLPNVELLREGYGGRDPWWFETGMEWGDGVVYPHGVDERFARFHLDKVFPTLGDLSAASQRSEFNALKYEIERMRLYPSIVGYVITEFTDVHWECNGLLDMCRNPKAFYDDLAAINADDMLVPTTVRAVLWAGDRCEVSVSLSHFSAANLSGAALEWRLAGWPAISGEIKNVDCAQGQARLLGTIAFDTPELAESTRLRLDLRLVGADGAVLASNHQEIDVLARAWAAPAPVRIYAPELAETLRGLGFTVAGSLAEADVALATTLTDGLRAHVETGGRVLWLAEGSDTQHAYLNRFGVAPRAGRGWQGDWASSFSWLRQDRIFTGIPSAGLVDFAFKGLTPDNVIVGCAPAEFEGDVHAGLFVGWLHDTVALVAERRYGAGRLLACTFQLSTHLADHPVALTMLNDLLRYVTRPA